ncbi:NADH-ubiquinone oxidoreductase-F iron-sulfur binding region domain-containing protein [Rhodococcus sp. P1Y]|uniref:NADH-ubiquinone oxidoreductase-F iron-sulfur binding region domain-containing protein n=1 Tax=Rhodococcus sp. P1Y TaxID=1302308 RepID=UPI000EAC8726|nr:NADH-ubiquinone oxidoreductase-F iron-sulfur binding region domain-containing protein [Rhodococcus sp. P1Y]AYJ50313.1 hypothetical protein D8W71_20780 [Rhodococcus sp. P1Y]
MSVTTDAGMNLRTAAFPGTTPRLITGSGREDYDAYVAGGGYAPISDAEALLTLVSDAGLRGRGGAAFPLAQKIRTVKTGPAVPVLLANGEEGEPASVKDRWLMRYRPHLVLDGVRLAAAMVGAEDVYIYVSDRASATSLRDALAQLPETTDVIGRACVHEVDSTYVAGEETAAVRSINGGPALPQDKPPRPFQSGVHDRPTLVSNVETLANLPYVQQHGAAEYRTVGTEDSAGTFLMTLTGTANNGLYEVPFGTTLAEVLRWLGDETAVTGALVGGYFAGVLSARVLDIPLDYAELRAAGSGLGCGAMAVIDSAVCPVAVSADVLAYFDRENAGQCGSCFNGTAAMAAAMAALCDGRADDRDVERLRAWSVGLRGRGACGTLDGAANVAAGVLREYPELVTDHLNGLCGACAQGRTPNTRPYAAIGEDRRSFA